MARKQRAKAETKKSSAGPTTADMPANDQAGTAPPGGAHTYFMRDFPVAAGRTRAPTTPDGLRFRRGRIWA